MYHSTSLEFGNGGEPKVHLISTVVMLVIKLSLQDNDMLLFLELQFQRCSQHPPKVIDICNEGSLSDGEN